MVQQRARGCWLWLWLSLLLLLLAAAGLSPTTRLQSPKFSIRRSQVLHSIAPLGLVVSEAPNTEAAPLPPGLGVHY